MPVTPASSSDHPHDRPLLALSLRLASMLLLSTMLMLVKFGGQRGLHVPEVLFWRQLIPGTAIFVWLAAQGQLARLKTDRVWLHAKRGVLGNTNMFLIMMAVQILPLSEATVLNFTSPVFAVLLSALVLREIVGPYRWAAVIMGLAGVLIIVGFDSTHLPVLGVALGLGGAFGGAFVSIQIRQLASTEEPIRVVFWFSLTGAVMALPALLIYGQRHDAADWTLIAIIGLTGLASQILMTAALRYGTVSSVIVMDYSQLFWATILGWLVFSQLPPAATWVGAPVIAGAGMIIAWREHLRHRQLPPSPAPLAD